MYEVKYSGIITNATIACIVLLIQINTTHSIVNSILCTVYTDASYV